MSARPTVGDFTERLYASLPELYRDADAAQDTGASNYPLLRYLSLLLDQLDPIAALRSRLTYVPLDERGTIDSGRPFGLPAPWQRYGSDRYGDGLYGDAGRSDLVDPTYADAAWLPWLAQLLGVDNAGLSPEDARTKLASPAETWAHGTPSALKAAARAALPTIGGYIDTLPGYGGDPFRIAVVTRNAETYGATTFAELRSLVGPTWADLKALGSFGNAEAADIMRAAAKERPAGYVLEHAYLEDLKAPPAPPIVPATNLLGPAGGFETDADVAKWVFNSVFGTYVTTTITRAVGDSSEGSSAGAIAFPANGKGNIMFNALNLVPGTTYRVVADVKVPASYGPDIFMDLLFKTSSAKVPKTGQWETVTSPLYVADSAGVFIGFHNSATAAGTVLVDNVRLYAV